MIEVGGRQYRTLSDDIYVNGLKVYEVFANGMKVYPEDSFVGRTIVATLTWNTDPRDLDAHMTGNGWHVYYAHKDSGNGECHLDVDDTTSYGPEHITLVPMTDGTYNYYVHHYAGSGSISTSGASVVVTVDGAVVATYAAPSSITGGVGSTWNVFSVVNGEIV